MHQEVKTFLKAVKRKFPWKFRNKRVLEAGSQNINGSPRKYFWLSKEYVGIDIMPGKGVDKVINVINYQKGIQHYPLKRFDTVVSTEMLEHDENWQQSLVAMYNLLETGGLLIITCAGPHRQEHGTRRTTPNCSPATPDYYRNISVEDFENILPPILFSDYCLQYASGKQDLQFYGIKNHRISGKMIYQQLNNPTTQPRKAD